MIDIMLIPNISKEPDLALRCEHSHAQSVHWRIPKAFVVETASFVQPVEVGFVSFATPEVEGADFEVGEELAVVVLVAVGGFEEPAEICFRVDKMGVSCGESHCSSPKRGKRACIVKNIHVKSVLHVVIPHESEYVVVDVAEIMNLVIMSSSLEANAEGLHQVQLSNTNRNS